MLREDHTCIYRNEPVVRPLNSPIWPVQGDPVYKNGEVAHICSVIGVPSKELGRWRIIDCQGREYQVSHYSQLDGMNVLGWKSVFGGHITLELEKANVRQGVKRGWILVWKGDTGFEQVVSWQVYATKALAEAAKTRELLKTLELPK